MFEDKKTQDKNCEVRDHFNYASESRGSAHSICNLIVYAKKLP